MANKTNFPNEFRSLMEKYNVVFDVDGNTVTLMGNDNQLVSFKSDADSETWDRVIENMIISNFAV